MSERDAVGGLSITDLPFFNRSSVSLKVSVSVGHADADVYFLPVCKGEIVGDIPSNLSLNPAAVLAQISFGSKIAVLAPGTRLGFYINVPLTPRSAAQVGADIVDACSALQGKVIGIVCPSDAMAHSAAVPCVIRELLIGSLLAAYSYPALKRRSAAQPVGPSAVMAITTPDVISTTDSVGIALAASAVADGCYFARDLTITPPNILHPAAFAECLHQRLTPLGVTVDILDTTKLEQLGAHGLLAVGRGSARKPLLAVCTYDPYKLDDARGRPPMTAIVGKGITMDTGGINLKTYSHIADMKADMGGAAVAAAVVSTAAALQLPIRVAAVLAIAENMPDGDAYRPGDVLQMASGITVEVHDTDCEGRVALADALWYAVCELRADRIIDIATLTGGVIAALGHACAGVFANAAALEVGIVDELRRCGHSLNEDVWPLPIGSAFLDAIKSDVADVKNVAEDGAFVVASASTAAAFLSLFVPTHIPWAHLDVAGTHLVPKHPLNPRHKGNPSWGVRLLTEWLASHTPHG